MRTVLAYVIVVALGQYCFGLGMLVAAWVCGVLFPSSSDRIRVPAGALVAATAGSAATVAFASAVFRSVAGAPAFGPLPFLAAVLSLLIPIRVIWEQYGELKRTEGGAASESTPVTPETAGAKASLIGALLGIVIGAMWLVSW